MAVKWPLANGVWSNAANWNDSTKPVPGDVVYADGNSIDIDEDVTVAELRNGQRSGGTNGGSFTSVGVVTITCDVFSGSDINLTLNASGVFVGNSYGGSGQSTYAVYCTKGGCHFGNSFGGSGNNAYGTYCNIGGIHNGNAKGGTGTNAYGTSVANGGIFYGNCEGTQAYGTRVREGGIGIIGSAVGTPSAWGCLAIDPGQIMIVKNPIGDRAYYAGSNTDQTYDKIPWAKPPALNTFAALSLGNRLAQRGVNL